MLAQVGGSAGEWLVLQLEGRDSNRSAIGAIATVRTAGGTQRREVRSGGSYLSQHELRLHFGLGRDSTADVEVVWPSGVRQVIEGLAAGRAHTIQEQRSGG